MSGSTILSLMWGSAFVVLLAVYVVSLVAQVRMRRELRKLQDAHTAALQRHTERAERDGRTIEALNVSIGDAHRELQLREVRLSGKPRWVDGFKDEHGDMAVRFALDGGVIVGAIVRESGDGWRSYGRLPDLSSEAPGQVQWSLVLNPCVRAQAEAERIMAALHKHQREHAARREVLS